MYRCSTCGCLWDDTRALDNELTCTRHCGGSLAAVAPVAHSDLDGCDFSRFPYPVALTALRLLESLRGSGDVLKTLFLLKDCLEATVKYLGAVLLAEYRLGPPRTPERTEVLLKALVRPSLGAWVSDVVRPLSLWLLDAPPRLEPAVAALFAQRPAKPGGRPAESALLEWCKQFVTYRNDALGHGARRSDSTYADDLARWLPSLRQLLDGVAGMNPWRLCLVTGEDRFQVWLGPRPGTATISGAFRREQIGRFVLCGPGGVTLDLYPFLCYLPDPRQQNRLHFYDSLYRYQATRKEATVLEYDHGERHPRAEPAVGLEEAFTTDLLAKAFKWHRGRMEVIEGRVANFGELIEAHASIVGRRFAVERVRRFLAEHDRGLLVIEAQPGKGKTALLAHFIEDVFGAHAPRPVHFFYRRTAGITSPDVCVRSLYYALLDTHDITEAEESKQKNTPEEVFTKLTNLLSREIAPRLLPGRPQLLFIDALDEADAGSFRRIPENLPAGVYVVATTRPVADRTALARRQDVHWYDLDAPDLVQENLRDGFEYVQRELVGTALPNESLDELARIGSGNFLVLELLCQQIRSTLRPDAVPAFMRSLATAEGKDQLGFIYADFWKRLVNRCVQAEVFLLCDVAGVLVTANAPLTAGIVCGVLALRAVEWDFALRQLGEYLTAIEHEEDGVHETFYRVYHESFADFLRAKVAVDRQRICDRLAEYCEGWSRLPEGYGRTYGLRFAVKHVLEARRWSRCTAILTDPVFLEAKTAAGLVFDLALDYSSAVEHFPPDTPGLRLLRLLEEALRRDIHFIHHYRLDYPQGLFQCFWNTCWWHDSPAASEHYLPQAANATQETVPWEADGASLSKWMESWRSERERGRPGFCWLRSLRPPPIRLGVGQKVVFSGNGGFVWSVAISADGRRVVNGGGLDNTVRVWDVNSGAEMNCIRGHSGGVRAVAFAPDGREFASGGEDSMVRLWDTRSGKEVRCLRGHEDTVVSLAYGAHGRRIVSGGWDDTVRVWDTDSGAELRCIKGHEDRVYGVAISADGRRIASGSGDGTVRLWDGQCWDQLHCFRGHEGAVKVLACTPDCGRIVSGSEDGTVRLWNVLGGAELLCLRGHRGLVGAVAISADGRRIVSGGWDSTMRVWDTDSGAELHCYKEHLGTVHSVAFGADAHLIAWSAGDLGTIRVWDANVRVKVRELIGEADGEPQSLQFTGDGRRVIFVKKDGTVRYWDADTGRCLTVLSGDVMQADRLLGTARARKAVFHWLAYEVQQGDGKVLALLPNYLGWLVGEPNGRTWAGGSGSYVGIFKLEGAT